jgi:hypothetical protein
MGCEENCMSDDLAEITVALPAAVVDRLRGSQSRASVGWNRRHSNSRSGSRAMIRYSR